MKVTLNSETIGNKCCVEFNSSNSRDFRFNKLYGRRLLSLSKYVRKINIVSGFSTWPIAMTSSGHNEHDCNLPNNDEDYEERKETQYVVVDISNELRSLFPNEKLSRNQERNASHKNRHLKGGRVEMTFNSVESLRYRCCLLR